MLGHISFGVEDLARSAAFYDQVLAPLGYVRVWTKPHAAGFGAKGGGDKLALFAKPGAAAAPGPGFHLAFDAPSRDAVDAFHAAALRAGGTDCGGPGLRPQYGATYYAAFVFDLDGHKLEAVHRRSSMTGEIPMKITRVETGIVALPNDEPLAGFSENPNAKNPIVWLRLGTDAGVEGLGVTYFGGALTRTLRHAVDELGALAIGEDPMRVEAVAAKLRAAAVSAGPAGIFLMALSAIDVALWDIKGKALGLPLWKLLGGGRDHIATYASGALRRGLKLDEAVTAAGRLREKGHRQAKMQLGLPGVTSPAREVEQARLIRQAVGPDMDLMCDINQRWRPEQAIDIGRRVEDAGIGLYWLEDVTTHDDYSGLARVAAALSTPVAGGEYLYGIVPFRHMLEARSVDIVMIDQVRCGGITPWLKIAGMAEAFNLPVVSHGVPEIHVHLVGAVPNGLTVEYMPRLFQLWDEVPVPRDGLLAMPTAPGLGLKISADAIKRFGAA